MWGGRFAGSLGHGYEAVVALPSSGTYSFHLVDGGGAFVGPCGTLQVPPRLVLCGRTVGPSKISLQTVVHKWIKGGIDKWHVHFAAVAAAGYNMVHFTPLQRRGHSNSPYSLRDHNEISPDLFVGSDGDEHVAPPPAERLESLREKVRSVESSLGLLSMIDVVWNHASCDSAWLLDHPEAGYTLQNSPHLQMAYDLDECILDFSSKITSPPYNASPHLRTEDDVALIVRIFAEHALPRQALWEYFVVDVAAAASDLENFIKALSPFTGDPSLTEEAQRWASLEDAKALTFDEKGYGRNRYRMDVDRVALLYRPQIEQWRGATATGRVEEAEASMTACLGAYRQQLDLINVARYAEYDAKVALILANMAGRISYERVALHGPRMGPISERSPLLPTYFTRLGRADGSGATTAFANNGWIWNADPLVNFAESTSDAYFTRSIIVWGDCVKLHYGASPADSPWLWAYMREYTVSMARLFHAFRIDNCHSTPLHVAEYLLAAARSVRPELYVVAELFTGSQDVDMAFIRRLGLNSLIREAMSPWDPAELAKNLVEYGGQPLGTPHVRCEHWTATAPPHEEQGIVSSRSTPHALYMDCTHDNETPSQKRTVYDALPNAAAVAMCSAAIGSVRGYDELVPKHLNIVDGTRYYPPPLLDAGLWRGKCVRQRAAPFLPISLSLSLSSGREGWKEPPW